MPKKTAPKTDSVTTTKQFIVITLSKLHVLILVLVLLALLYAIKGWVVAAVVDGKPITRYSLIKQLEQEQGKQALETTIDRILVEKEAKRQKLSVSDAEVSSEIKKIEENLSKQGQKLDEALAAQNMTRALLADQIKFQMVMTKLLEKDIKVTDKEVADFIEQNKATIPPEMDEKTVNEQAKKQLVQQKAQQAYQPWIENLRKQAKIWYFVDFK
jgi:hypothetical protein